MAAAVAVPAAAVRQRRRQRQRRRRQQQQSQQLQQKGALQHSFVVVHDVCGTACGACETVIPGVESTPGMRDTT